MEDMKDLGILITKADKKIINKLKNLMLNEKMTILREPTTGLIMATALDSFKTEFCLGEILVTLASIEYENSKGYGIIIGDEPDRALVLAFIMALMKSNNDGLKKKFIKTLSLLRETISKNEKIEKAIILKTKVNFETMVKR